RARDQHLSRTCVDCALERGVDELRALRHCANHARGLDVLHRFLVTRAQRADDRMIEIKMRAVAQQRLGEVVGIARVGIRLARSDGARSRYPNGGLRKSMRAMLVRRRFVVRHRRSSGDSMWRAEPRLYRSFMRLGS